MKNYSRNILLIIGIKSCGLGIQYNRNNFFKYFSLVFMLLSCNSSILLSSGPTVKYDKRTNLEVCSFTDKMPSYRGGYTAFLHDFSANFQYSNQIDNNIQTNIVVQYVINKKGRLVGARIFNKEDKDLSCFDKAVLEALEKVQDWTPGEYHHKKVNVIIKQTIQIDMY